PLNVLLFLRYVWGLPAPVSTSMDSVNMRHTLRWAPLQAPCNATVLYSVQYQGEFELWVGNGSWVDAADCQQIPHTHCDLTFDLGSDSDYNLQVRAQCDRQLSAWTRLSQPFNRRDSKTIELCLLCFDSCLIAFVKPQVQSEDTRWINQAVTCRHLASGLSPAAAAVQRSQSKTAVNAASPARAGGITASGHPALPVLPYRSKSPSGERHFWAPFRQLPPQLTPARTSQPLPPLPLTGPSRVGISSADAALQARRNLLGTMTPSQRSQKSSA
uniref:Fibronectin type-III domain-containing protein n=1 Tax=Salarias fasciatus TaxID=181472 RepID=A0A672G5H7_SALFA